MYAKFSYVLTTNINSANDPKVTWDMASEHVAVVDGMDMANFTSCGKYQMWVNMITSGNIIRIKTYYRVTGNVTQDMIRVEYRTQIKEG